MNRSNDLSIYWGRMRPVIVSVVACVCMWTGPVARSQQAQEPVLIATIPNLQPPDGLRPVSSGGHGYFGGRQRPAAYDAALVDQASSIEFHNRLATTATPQSLAEHY